MSESYHNPLSLRQDVEAGNFTTKGTSPPSEDVVTTTRPLKRDELIEWLTDHGCPAVPTWDMSMEAEKHG